MTTEQQRDEWWNRDARIFWIVIAGLLLLTRVPAAARYLSIDNVNLALSLENFDPLHHQPQPPGYPFFVAFGRAVNFVFRDPETTFLIMSVLASGLCLPLVFALGNRLFSVWVGRAAAALLLVNAVFWHSGLDGPLRPYLALFALLTAYCSWRCWNGEKQYLIWGACALAVGSGFRPDLLAYMFPVWLLSAWMGSRSVAAVARGILVLSAVVLVWVGALVFAVGGPRELAKLTLEYLVEQSRIESVLLGASEGNWLRQMNRLVTWNATAVLGWVWAIPVFFLSKDRLNLRSPESVFLLTWLVPGMVLQGLVHVAAPGHTLFSVPALCLIGGYVLFVATQKMTTSRDLLLSASLIVSVMMFLNYFPLPVPSGSTRGLERVKNALAYGLFESSLSQVRWLDDTSRLTLKEINGFIAPNRPTIIVSNDIHYQQWFMNWRIARYYLPHHDIWVVADQKTPRLAQHVRRDRVLEARTGSIVQVPVPKGGRVIWLLEHNNPLHKALSSVQNLTAGGYVFYTDIPVESAPFRALDFEFVPADYGIQ